MKRGHTREQSLKAIETITRETNVDLGIHLMFGQPGETDEAYMSRLQQGQMALLAKGMAAVLGNHVVIDHGNGEMVDEFTGALPPAQINQFLDRIVPAPEKSPEEIAEERAKELESNPFFIAGREAREELEASANSPAEAFRAWDEGDHEFAFDLLQKEVELAANDPDRRDLLRKVMVGFFTELGPESELAATHRRRLATVLS